MLPAQAHVTISPGTACGGGLYKNVDLHLLACFDALMTEQQVTRAAERMKMSQSAMSNALARLRELFKDPLLVRTSKGMVPTSRALELVETVRRGLWHIDDALTHSVPFDPGTADSIIKVMTTDYAAEMLMPALLAKLSREAPKLRVVIQNMDPSRIREALEIDESHLVIGYFQGLANDLYSSTLFTERMICAVRSGHPFVRGSIELEDYCRLGHACFAGFSHADLSTIEKVTDSALASLGRKRTVILQAGSILVILPIVAETDLLATVPLGSARRASKHFGLQVMALPFAMPDLVMSLIWHERTHRDQAHQWVRNAIRDVSKHLGRL